MRLVAQLFVLAASCGFGLGGCSRPARTVTDYKHFAVWGSPEALHRFLPLQTSRPELTVSVPRDIGQGKQRAEIGVPVTFTINDDYHLSREALAAGLSYEFKWRTRPA